MELTNGLFRYHRMQQCDITAAPCVINALLVGRVLLALFLTLSLGVDGIVHIGTWNRVCYSACGFAFGLAVDFCLHSFDSSAVFVYMKNLQAAMEHVGSSSHTGTINVV